MRVSVVAKETVAAAIREKIEAESGLEFRVLPPTPITPFARSYRSADVGVVAAEVAMPAAIVVQRLTRVPWIAVVDDRKVTALAARRRAARARSVRRATAVLAREGSTLVTQIAPDARVVPLDDRSRVLALIRDVALVPDARADVGRGAAAAIVAAWTFLNDRLQRLAIRLMRATGRAPEPLHPKHFIDAPWFSWYREELGEDSLVLDVGCANGAHTLTAAKHARRVIGIDVDAGALAHARARAAREGIRNVEFHRGDLADGRTLELLGREQFDVVMALDVLEHLYDRRAFLVAIGPLLRPGGRLVLSVPNRDTAYKLWRRRLGGFAYSDPDHKVEYSEGSLRAELEEAGFEVIQLQRAGYDSPFPGLTALLSVLSVGLYAWLAERRHRRGLSIPANASAFRAVAVPARTPATS